MIVYDSNRNWLRDIRNLGTSYTMQKIMKSTLVVGAVSLVIAVLEIDVFEMSHWRVDASVFSLLGIVLSILLVFRTNTAYDRWWEGRKLWGSLVNHCRNLAVMTHAALPEGDIATRRSLAIHTANFCIALKEHLRQGVKLDELIFLHPEEASVYKTKTHIPAYIAFQVQDGVQQSFKRGDISMADLINIKVHTQALLDIAGACERIRKTPIPFSYNVYLKIYISAYTLILPFGLIPYFGYMAVLLVMFIFFAFIGIELMAEEIEEPFGLDCNDLPTGNIAHAIKQNIFEILEIKQPESHIQEKLYVKEH